MSRSCRLLRLLIATFAVVLAACAQTPAAPVQAPAAMPTTVPQPTAAPTAAPTTVPQPTAQAGSTDAELAAKLDTALTKLNANQLFSGIVTVKRQQTVVLQKGYGFAERAAQTPFTSQTTFKIGELSMQFTAAATLLLEQQGKLSVQNSICMYIDSCPEVWKPVTLHHLLSHTAGIPEYTQSTAGIELIKTGATTGQIVALLRGRRLDFAPGAKRDYSHSGFALLGAVIERVSGQSYADFLHEQLFAPLGMQHTGYGTPSGAFAIGYQDGSNQQLTFDATSLGASGGLYTTSEDMLRWIDGLYSGKLLDAAQLKKMLTSHAAFGDRQELGSGYGIVLATVKGHLHTYQCGGPIGYGSCVVHFLQDDISIVVFGNQDNMSIVTITDATVDIVLGDA
jgi:CubicO group peptidase (beta-lactamase class C family)